MDVRSVQLGPGLFLAFPRSLLLRTVDRIIQTIGNDSELKANVYGLTGKSTPRLITDLLDYDPIKSKKNGKNILADNAPQYKGKPIIRKGVQDCHHTLMKKLDRTHAPVSQDQQPDGSTRWLVAAYCSDCRCHFDVTVDFKKRWGGRQTPCQLGDPENPLHHLRRVSSEDAREYEERHGGYNKYDTISDTHRFECSGVTCPCVVDIKISPPKLGSKILSLITDPKKVYARGRKIIQEEPQRFDGHKPIQPYQAVDNLRTYLRDARLAKEEPENRKKIAKRNKRLLLGFADECDSLFEYLDFKVVKEDGPDPVMVCSSTQFTLKAKSFR
jgi:ubiquitin carboxyl-terminal hydrolase 25/28